MFRILGETFQPAHLLLSGLALKEALLLQSAQALSLRKPTVRCAASYYQ